MMKPISAKRRSTSLALPAVPLSSVALVVVAMLSWLTATLTAFEYQTNVQHSPDGRVSFADSYSPVDYASARETQDDPNTDEVSGNGDDRSAPQAPAYHDLDDDDQPRDRESQGDSYEQPRQDQISYEQQQQQQQQPQRHRQRNPGAYPGQHGNYRNIASDRRHLGARTSDEAEVVVDDDDDNDDDNNNGGSSNNNRNDERRRYAATDNDGDSEMNDDR